MDTTQNLKLYKVVTVGMRLDQAAYVVATDPTTAYQKVYKALVSNSVGVEKDRALDYIEQLAGVSEYFLSGNSLFI